MGCGPSNNAVAESSQAPITHVKPISKENSPAKQLVFPVKQSASPVKVAADLEKPSKAKLPPINSSYSPNKNNSEQSNKGFVAFDIVVDGKNTNEGSGAITVNQDIEKIFQRPLPTRLKRLEPLPDVPALTPEQLAEKLRKAELKREKMLEKRRNSEVTKASRVRRELLKAQEFTGESSPDVNGATPGLAMENIQEKQASADERRAAKLAAVKAKQQAREERAKAARERAMLIREKTEIEIERDTTANDSDTDSWLGEDDAAGKPKTTTAPHRQVSSGYSSRDPSADFSSRVTTGKTVSTCLDDEDRDAHDFFE